MVSFIRYTPSAFGNVILTVLPRPRHSVGVISSGKSCTVSGHQYFDFSFVSMQGQVELARIVVVVVEVVDVVVVEDVDVVYIVVVLVVSVVVVVL